MTALCRSFDFRPVPPFYFYRNDFTLAEGGLVQVDMHIRHYERIIRDEKLKRGDIS